MTTRTVLYNQANLHQKTNKKPPPVILVRYNYYVLPHCSGKLSLRVCTHLRLIQIPNKEKCIIVNQLHKWNIKPGSIATT